MTAKDRLKQIYKITDELVEKLNTAVNNKFDVYEVETKVNGHTFNTYLDHTEYLELVVRGVSNELFKITEVEETY